MTDRTWKSCERRIAHLLGGTRNPINGRGQSPDIAHPTLAVEVKHRQALPGWLLQAMRQAGQGAAPGQTAIVVLHQAKTPYRVLHQAKTPYRDSLVVLTLADFIQIKEVHPCP